MRRPRPVPDHVLSAPFGRRDVPELSSRQLAGPAFERLTRGAYRVVDDEDEGRRATYGERVAGLLAVLPQRAVLVGASAAWAMRAWAPLPTDPVEVGVHPPGSVRPREGVRISSSLLRADEVVRRRAGWMTTPLRTALDVARRPGALTDVVPMLDAVLRVGTLLPSDVLAAVDAAPGHRGNARARAALSAADPLAESPRESLVRLAVLGAGLPRPVLQHWVLTRRGRRYRLDLAWPQHRVAVEYDGRAFHGHERWSADLARHNDLREEGWVVLQLDGPALDAAPVWLAQLATLLG